MVTINDKVNNYYKAQGMQDSLRATNWNKEDEMLANMYWKQGLEQMWVN